MYTEKTETTLVTAELDAPTNRFSVKVDHQDVESSFLLDVGCVMWLSKDELLEIRKVINKVLREFGG